MQSASEASLLHCLFCVVALGRSLERYSLFSVARCSCTPTVCVEHLPCAWHLEANASGQTEREDWREGETTTGVLRKLAVLFYNGSFLSTAQKTTVAAEQ